MLNFLLGHCWLSSIMTHYTKLCIEAFLKTHLTDIMSSDPHIRKGCFQLGTFKHQLIIVSNIKIDIVDNENKSKIEKLYTSKES